MSQGFVNQKYYEVKGCLGEMVSSDDETTLENCRTISEVTRASTPQKAQEMVSRQFASIYPRKDGYVVKDVSAEEI